LHTLVNTNQYKKAIEQVKYV
jgi:hypothetical protein